MAKKQSKKNNLIQKLVEEIKTISEGLGVHPSQLKKPKFLELSGHSEWELRKVGGFTALINSYFPDVEKDITVIEYHKQRNSYVRTLEQKVARLDLFRAKLEQSMKEIVSQAKIEVIQFDKTATESYLKSIHLGDKTGDKRSVCTIWSDQHFGTNVNKDEMNGINEFNWVIGARRLGMLCEQIATFKIEKRNLHEELVIFLLGDNIAGVIHNLEGSHNELSIYQIAGTFSYYVQAFNYLKQFFPKIRVYCQPGNHGRVMHKVSKDRALQQKFDSLENYIFVALSGVFYNDPKVEIHAVKSPFCDVDVQGHRIFATHGDTVFGVGNPGKTVPLYKIERQVNHINGESTDRPYEMYLTGHVHHPVYTHVGKGVKVLVNGCLIGTDPFALSLGIANSQPTQALWEATKKYVEGDTRSIYVADADDKNKYDKIIKPYTSEIVFEKGYFLPNF